MSLAPHIDGATSRARLPTALRRLQARAASDGALHIDSSVLIGRRARIQVAKGASAHIGRGCQIGAHVRIFVRSGTLTLGEGVVLEEWSTILVLHSVSVGDRARLRERAAIIDLRPCYEDVEAPLRMQGVTAFGVQIGAGAVLEPSAVAETGARIPAQAHVAARSSHPS